jgi:hypothetical protein
MRQLSFCPQVTIIFFLEWRGAPSVYLANGRFWGFAHMTPGQLVKAMAVALNMPEEVVVQHDRNLAMAGLRTKKGRGPSAAEVTPLDAARLLAATLGSVRNKDSVYTVSKFERTKMRPRVNVDEIMADWLRSRGAELPEELKTIPFSDPAIDGLPQTHNFIEGIAALISDASGPIEDIDQYLQRFALIFIEFGGKLLPGIARIGRWSQHRPVDYEPAWRKASTKEPEPEQPEVPRHQRYARYYGINQQRDIYGSAIMLLGKAFRDGGLPFETTKDALDALLGSKKTPAKSKKAT